MFGWLTGAKIKSDIEAVRDAGIELGQVRAAATVQVYQGDVDVTRTYTGFEVEQILDTIVTVLLLKPGQDR